MLDRTSPAVKDTIRRAGIDDILSFLEIAKERYPDRLVHRGIPWFCAAIRHQDMLVLIGDNSAGIASVYLKYGFETTARVELISSRPVPGAALEGLRMLRVMLRWAKDKGAMEFRLDSDNGTDFAAFAKRLGGKPITWPRYVIPL